MSPEKKPEGQPPDQGIYGIYSGRLRLPDGTPWIGDESSGFPKESQESQSPTTPSGGEIPEEKNPLPGLGQPNPEF